MKLKEFFNTNRGSKILFLLVGSGSIIWFLIRVIPKPSRAGYPCMRAAAPIMSGFVMYLLGLGGSVLFFKKTYLKFKQAKYGAALLALLCFLIFAIIFNIQDARSLYSKNYYITDLPDAPNSPMGVGRGIFPGRVVWEWNAVATNKNCKNTDINNCCIHPANNNQDTISKMAANCIKKLSDKKTVKEGWDGLFKNFNQRKTGKSTGYTTGQTIFIKVNNGSAMWNTNSTTMGWKYNIQPETTPATVMAILTQLVDSCGIPQECIYIGEPMSHLFSHLVDPLLAKYPKVKYLEGQGYTAKGRTLISGWKKDAIVYSDKGTVMPDAVTDDLCNEMYNANYLINIAALKAHARGGVTLCAKLHFGSQNRGGADHLHAGLISVAGNDMILPIDKPRKDYGMYRVLTDLIGHEKLGGNTVLFIVDGLWGGPEATDPSVKWQMAPFNNNWPNSLFASQDEVAIESVCLDFLRAEATVNTAFKNRPFFPAVDDYLHQAASKANWAKGITYDPEGDGTEMPASLGVHEHWNNSVNKQYSKNISLNGTGIELISTFVSSLNTGIHGVNQLNSKVTIFPTMFSTELHVEIGNNNDVIMSVYNLKGQLLFQHHVAGKFTWDGETSNGEALNKGLYVLHLRDLRTNRTITSCKITRN